MKKNKTKKVQRHNLFTKIVAIGCAILLLLSVFAVAFSVFHF